MVKVAALYCRLSPRPDGSYEGVDAQERWGREYAASAWPGEPVEVFADAGISAANGDHRPEYERLRQWVADGRVGHVWAVEQTRLERREVEWFVLAAELDDAGIAELHTNRDGIVRVRDEVSGIKAVIAAGEARKLRRRTVDTLAERAAEGRPHGGRTFGYRRALDEQGRKALVVEPHEADTLRDAATKVLSGWSLSSTAHDLAARGIIGANGRPLTYSTLKRMLTNSTVAGKRAYRGRVVGDGNWPPILDLATHRALRERLDGPRAVRRRDGGEYAITANSYGHSPRSRRRFLLTGGVAVCGVCGGPHSAQRRRVKARSPAALYTCRDNYCTGIAADGLEDHVRDVLLDEFDRPEFLEAVAADNHAGRREEIYAAFDEGDRKRGELAAMWTRGELTDTEWQAARRSLAEQDQALDDGWG